MSTHTNKLVSVLIPAFNHDAYVTGAIRSVINQTYNNIELIVIDDGSPDETWKKITDMKKECEKRFKRVLFKTQKNQGTSTTFERLTALAEGEYITICASDDAYEPTFIEKCVRLLEKNKDIGLAVVDSSFMDEASETVYWGKEKTTVRSIEKAVDKTFGEHLKKVRKDVDFSSPNFGSYESLLKGNYIPQGIVFKKTLLSKIEPCNKKAPLEDWFFILQMAKQTQMKYIDEPLYRYRWHADNSIKKRQKMKKFGQQTLKHEIECVKASKDKKWLATALKASVKEKNIFKIGNAIRLFKHRDAYMKKIILKIGGREFVLKTKKIG